MLFFGNCLKNRGLIAKVTVVWSLPSTRTAGRSGLRILLGKYEQEAEIAVNIDPVKGREDSKVYSIYEMNMPEEHIEILACMSLELGTYADALVECLIKEKWPQ